MFCVYAGRPLCILMFLLSTLRKITSLLYLRRIRRTWRCPRSSCQSSWSVRSAARCCTTSSRRCRTSTGTVRAAGRYCWTMCTRAMRGTSGSTCPTPRLFALYNINLMLNIAETCDVGGSLAIRARHQLSISCPSSSHSLHSSIYLDSSHLPRSLWQSASSGVAPQISFLLRICLFTVL